MDESLNTQLNQPTNQNSIKVPKVVEYENIKTLGTRVINSRAHNHSVSLPKLVFFIMYIDIDCKMFHDSSSSQCLWVVLGYFSDLPPLLRG